MIVVDTSVWVAVLGSDAAAEAPTLSGGIFYLMRSAGYRPRVIVRGSFLTFAAQ